MKHELEDINVVPMRDTDYELLASHDWTFADAKTRGETHGIHPYPAKFIPQIPRTLIRELYANDGTAILDPFCGSGTTLVEAALAGAPSVGVDLHPLACLISKVKVTPLSISLIGAAEMAIGRSRDTTGIIPDIPGLDHWFKPAIQLALAKLIAGIDEDARPDVRDALRVAFSSIVVRVSNQDSDTRYAAVDKPTRADDVVTLFRQAARGLEESLQLTWGGLFPAAPTRIIHQDILRVRAEDIGRPVSLVITSPPYPNAYEYWLYHKYRMYWLGMDPLAVKAREIGARPHFFKSKPHTAEDFGHQMVEVFRLFSQILVRGGHACFQVGSSRIRGQIVDNAALLRTAAHMFGFSEAASMARAIPTNRKSFNPTNARIKDETILVFRRDD